MVLLSPNENFSYQRLTFMGKELSINVRNWIGLNNLSIHVKFTPLKYINDFTFPFNTIKTFILKQFLPNFSNTFGKSSC